MGSVEERVAREHAEKEIAVKPKVTGLYAAPLYHKT
jgi:hypothetical protein